MHTHYDGACQIVHHGDEANVITKVITNIPWTWNNECYKTNLPSILVEQWDC